MVDVNKAFLSISMIQNSKDSRIMVASYKRLLAFHECIFSYLYVIRYKFTIVEPHSSLFECVLECTGISKILLQTILKCITILHLNLSLYFICSIKKG